MKISEIPYYVLFDFKLNQDKCFAVKSRHALRQIKEVDSGLDIDSLKIGNLIYFEFDANNKYEIINIKITQLFNDTDHFNIGFDSEGCSNIFGENKQELFKITIYLNIIS